MEERKRITFLLRVIHNQIKSVVQKTGPDVKTGPKTQLQGGILGYLYHHRDQPVYQKDLEKEFRISGATVSNTLQVMEREGLIVRKAQDRDGRLKRIQMTGEAYQNHEKIERHMDWMGDRLLAGMADSEVSELYRLLGILVKNLEEITVRAEESPAREPESEACSEKEAVPEELPALNEEPESMLAKEALREADSNPFYHETKDQNPTK